MGTVQGIALDFKGSASIDWIQLKSNGVMVMEESFDVAGTTTATIILQSGTLITGALTSPVLTGYIPHSMNIVRSVRYNDPGMIEDKSQLQVLREQEIDRQRGIKMANDRAITAQKQACEIGIGGIAAYSPEYKKQLIDTCK